MADPKEQVALVSPTGQAGTAPASAVDALLARGYKLDQGESEQAREAIRYGGVGDAVSAAAQGAARTAIPGYDLAAQAIVGALPGGDAERTRRYLAGLKEHQAGASAVGEMAGYFAGAGALAGRGGAALAGRIAGEGAGLLRGAAGAVAGGALEGAAAGVGEGLSQVGRADDPVTAERLAGALGQSIVRGAGMGAGAAGVLHLGGKLAGGGLRSTREALARRMPKGDGEPGLLRDMWASAASRLSGIPKDDLLKASAGRNPAKAAFDAPRVATAAKRTVADDLTTVLRGGDDIRGLHVGGEREATFAHLVDGDIGAHATQARSVVAQVRDSLDNMAAVPGKQARKTVKPVLDDIREQVDTLADEMEEAIARGDSAAVNQRLNAIKQRVGDLKKSADAGAGGVGRKRVYWQEPARLADELYETARKSLEDESVWGRAGRAQRAINAPVTEHLQFTDFQSKFTRKFGKNRFEQITAADDDKIASFVDRLGTGQGGRQDREMLERVVQGRADAAKALLEHARPQMSKAEVKAANDVIAAADRIKATIKETAELQSLAGGLKDIAARDGMTDTALLGGVLGGGAGAVLGGVVGALTKPGRFLQQYAALQNITGRMGDRVGSSLRGLFATAQPGGIAHAVPRLVQPLDDRLAEQEPGYKVRAEATKLRQSTPEQVAADVDRSLRPELTRAPAVVDMAAATAARQHAALRAASPDPVSKYLLGPAPTPSATEIDRFERAKRAVADYPSVLEDVRNGTVSPDTVDLLKSVYPAEYENIRQRAMDQIAEVASKGQTLPYEQRRALGILLDMPVEPLQDPELVRDIQAAFAPVEPQRKVPSATPGQRRERVNSYRTGSQDTAADAEG